MTRTYLKTIFMQFFRGRDDRSHEEKRINCGSGGPRRDNDIIQNSSRHYIEMDSNNNTAEPELRDLHPSRKDIRADVLAGLRAPRKWISSMYFYDARGSQLFDQITALDEYYPTRTERGILQRYGEAIAAALGPDILLIEPGSGSSEKVRLLLDHLQAPVAYVPVEISREHLTRAAAQINSAYPALEVLPVCADFTQEYEIPAPARAARRRVVYFPGSTIGNFEPADALALLHNFRRVVGAGGALLIGVDLRKDRATLEAAYNDSKGVTAAFNLNVLARFNHELGADFNLDAFQHRAIWNETESRIEMHLVSLRDQTVHIGGEPIAFAQDEYIHTESSYKYTPEGFAQLAGQAGFALQQVWMDERKLFSVQYLEAV